MEDSYRLDFTLDDSSKHHAMKMEMEKAKAEHGHEHMKDHMMMEDAMDGCGFMTMMMGDTMCMGATSMMAYATPLAAAIAVAAF